MSSGSLGSLVVRLEADIAQFSASLTKSEQMARQAMGAVEKSVGLAKAAFVGLGVAMSATSFAGGIKGAIDMMDNLDKLSQKTGVTVESLSAMKTAAKYSEVGMDQVGAAIQKLSKNMIEFDSTGKGKAAQAFQALGISVRDASGHIRNADDVMLEAAKKLDTFKDGTTKTALEMMLFGKSGAELGGFLKELADRGLDHAKVTSEEAKQAAELNDKFKTLETQSKKLSLSIAKDLLPALNDISTAMVEAAKDGGILNAIWVGMGGTMAHILGLDDASQKASALRDIDGQIKEITATLAAGTKRTDKGIVGLTPQDVSDLTKKLHDLALEKAKLDAAAAVPTKPAAKAEAPDIVDPEKLAKEREKAAKHQAMFNDMIAKYGDTLNSVNGIEKTHAQTLQEELDRHTDLSKVEKVRLQGIIDRVAAQEKLNDQYRKAAEFEDVMRRSDDLALSDIEAQSSAEEANAKALQDKALALRETLDPQLKMMNMQDEYFQMLSAGLITQEEYDKALTNMAEKSDTTFQDMKRAIEGYGDSFAKMVASGKFNFSSLVTSILTDIERLMVKRTITDPLMKMIDGMFSGSGSSNFGDWFAGFFGGGKAVGGPVDPSQVYMVGENGPEMFVPHSAGTIVPNSKLGGGSGNVSVTINNSMSDQASVTAQPKMNNGRIEIEVMVQRIINQDIRKNGPITQGIGQAFGLGRAV